VLGSNGAENRFKQIDGPDDKKASKAVLGIIFGKNFEVQLHKWFRKSANADLRYDIRLQKVWIEIIR
jgi:hypothetical protein